MLISRLYREGGEQVAGKSKYTFESKIHVYRATKRMTQQELADLVGMSRQTIMRFERNRYNPLVMEISFTIQEQQRRV